MVITANFSDVRIFKIFTEVITVLYSQGNEKTDDPFYLLKFEIIRDQSSKLRQRPRLDALWVHLRPRTEPLWIQR